MGLCGCWRQSKCAHLLAQATWILDAPADVQMNLPFFVPKSKVETLKTWPLKFEVERCFSLAELLYIYECFIWYMPIYIYISLTSSLGWFHANDQICGSIWTRVGCHTHPRCRPSPQSFHKALRWQKRKTKMRLQMTRVKISWRFLDSFVDSNPQLPFLPKANHCEPLWFFFCFLF